MTASAGESAVALPSRVKQLLLGVVFLVQLSRAVLHLAWMCVYYRVLFFLRPARKHAMVEHMNEVAHMKDTWMEVSDWQDTLFTWQFFKQDAKMLMLDFYQKVHLHGDAENVKVVKLDGTMAKLLDFSTNEERPLVVNFGSCT